MKIDVTTVLTELDGTPLLISDMRDMELCPMCAAKLAQIDKKPLTLRRACTRSLTAMTREVAALPGQEKFERGMLATVIYAKDEPDLSVEQIAMLKDVLGKIEGPLVVLQTYELLDPRIVED